jgi:hypothetical protein
MKALAGAQEWFARMTHMATLEDLGRMAMVEVDQETSFATSHAAKEGWSRMVLILAASAAVCGLIVSLKSSEADHDSGETALGR